MNKEIISDKQGISIMILFIVGTSIIYASGIKSKRDIWIAILLSVVIALPIVCIYARLHYIFPGKNLFDIYEICFGKIIGKGLVIVCTWFVFHTGILVLINLNLFIHTVSLDETPLVITMISIVLLCVWVVKEGIEVMGRWSNFFQIISMGVIFITIIFLIPNMDINNIRPVLYEGIAPVIKGAFGTFAFPFTQIVVFTIAFSNFKTKNSPFRIYIRGLFIGGMLIFSISTMNILVLGVELASRVYYPSHESATNIDIGNIIQRIEIIISAGFVIGAFIKGSIYLLATCKGIAKVFRCADYRFIVIPVALLMINVSCFLHDSVREYFHWIIEIWAYYAMPFQVIFPIIIWIVAEIKKNKIAT